MKTGRFFAVIVIGWVMLSSISFGYSGWIAGKTGNALAFDGVNDYVEVPDYSGIGGTSARTVSLWVKTSTSSQVPTLLQWGSDVPGQLWMLRIQANGTLIVAAYGGGVQSSRTVTDNQWHQIVAVLPEGQTDSNQILLYIDGQLDTVQLTASCTINTSQTVSVHLGAWYRPSTSGLSNYFSGLMDEVCIYGRALDASEIDPEAPIPTDGLVAHWAMDETEGKIAHDSVSSYDGILRYINGAYTCGRGTVEYPYQIQTDDDWMNFISNTADWDKQFILTTDIDMSGQIFNTAVIAPSSRTNQYFLGTAFSGVFDGNGHKITNLTINAPSRYHIGLFGYVSSGGQVKNLGLENISIIGHYYVGGLVGENGGTITACYSTGSVSGSSSVNGSSNNVGGLVGWNYGTITTCYSASGVNSSSGSNYIGGLVGYNSVTITACYSTGSVSGSSDVGGLVGCNNGTITSCYSTGNVSGGSGGFYIGGLVGENNSGNVIASFWDAQTSGKATSDGGIGKTTLEMKDMFIYSCNNWGDSWTIDSGNDYPHLSWENTVGTVITAPTVTMAGSGTANEPWIIASKEDFLQVCAGLYFWDKHYRLDTDINLSGTTYQLSLIGYDKDNYFTGVFDGNGHKLTCLTINVSSQYFDLVGLFGYIGSGGQVKNLGLENINITGQSFIGSLVGWNRGTITACYSTGSVSGGIVGGLVGVNGGAITSCYSAGSVNGGEVGGLVGDNSGAITSCYSVGSVSGIGINHIGGLIGHNSGTITACYSASSVSGSSDVGGLVGSNVGTIITCYSTGSVSGENYVGGLIGHNSGDGTITASFWDTQTSGQVISAGGIGKTTLQMKDKFIYSCNNWGDSWTIDSGNDYPHLVWENAVGTVIAAPTVTMTGSGTVEDPWVIASKEDFLEVCTGLYFWNKHCRLDTDIDLSGTIYQFSLIGYGKGISCFTGVFDGNGHKITNLTINSPTLDYVGLFGYVSSGGQVKNLGLENISITGQSFIGSLAGYNSGTITTCYSTSSVRGSSDDVGGLVGKNSGTITACYSTGTVVGSSDVGGLAGYNEGTITACNSTGSFSGGSGCYNVGGLVGDNYGTITACYSTGRISGTSHAVGGLAGENFGGSIASCYAIGNVSGSNYVGGLVGWNSYYSAITACYSNGSVNGTSNVGGLVGHNVSSTITACYSASNAIATNYCVGGLIGENLNGSIASCYAIGSVSGSYSGGLIGQHWDGSIISCFWDIQTSGKTVGVGSGSSVGVTGKTTAQMKTVSTFTSPSWISSPWGDDKEGFALSFGGIDDYVEVPGYSGIGGSGARTVSLWIKTSASGNPQALVQWGSDAAGQLWYLRVEADGKVFVSAYAAGVMSSQIVTDNQWHHIAAVLDEGQTDPTQIRLYIDGQLDAVPTGSGIINTTQDVPVHLGVWYGPSTGSLSNYFKGLIDEVCIYGRALEASEIDPEGPISTEGLIAHWAMDENEGSVVHDSVSSYDGIMKNFGDGWDFTNETLNGTDDIWRMCADGVDYPRLNWESIDGDFACPDGVSTEDLDYFVGRWLLDNCTADNNYCGGGDVDASGTVDLGDFAVLAGHWLEM